MARCPSTATRRSSCAPRSWARPTASSPCSPASTAGCGRWPRASARRTSRFGARLEPFGHVDVQLYEGRSPRHRHPGRVDRARTAAALVARLPALDRRARRCSRRPSGCTDEEREPAVQQYLLLVGGLRVAGRRRARPGPGARRLPAAVPGGRRLGAVLRRLRPLRRAGPAPRVLGRRRRRGVRRVPAARLGRPGPGDPRAARRPAHRRLGRRRRQRVDRARREAQRPGRGVPPVAPRARTALAAARRARRA